MSRVPIVATIELQKVKHQIYHLRSVVVRDRSCDE